MDRRNRRAFTPSGEDLEARKLLSTTKTAANPLNNNNGLSALTGGFATTPSLTYSTLVEKTVRIKHVPLFLKSIDPKRYIPPDAVTEIQSVMTEVRGILVGAKPYDLNRFNVLLRNILQEKTLSTSSIAALNKSVAPILADAGLTPTQISTFQTALTTLSKYDAQEANPVYVATNDYAILLQLTLGVGRPIDTPVAPTLLDADHLKGRAGAVTANTQPRLTGTYDPATEIRLFDYQGGGVLGRTVVGQNGTYTVAPDVPLAPGRYKFAVQGTDSSGELSASQQNGDGGDRRRDSRPASQGAGTLTSRHHTP